MSRTRPELPDLRSKSQASVSRPLRSPRLPAGEAPPELSPLDAFALQSRLLAKQLEESNKNGRRMSRLPPLTADSPLIVQARSEYFRSLSQDSYEDEEQQHPPLQNVGLGLKAQVDDDAANRPKSMHPRLSQVPPTPDDSVPVPALPKNTLENYKLNQPKDGSFFGLGARRERSPSPMGTDQPPRREGDSQTTQDGQQSRSTPAPSATPSSPERERPGKESFEAAGLIPPRPLFTKRSSSLASATFESTDEDGINTMSTSMHSQSSRKFSTSSSMVSPAQPAYQRSPSVASDASGLPRPQFNFSRPMSRAGTPSFDPPARTMSSDSQGSFFPPDDAASTALSSTTSRENTFDESSGAGSSYTYSKFTLPRGKALDRQSFIMLNDPPARPSLDQPATPPVGSHGFGGQPPPSPPTRPSSSSENQPFNGSPRRSPQRSKLGAEPMRPIQQPSPNPSRPSTESFRASEEEQRERSVASNTRDLKSSASSAATSDTASTIKASKTANPTGPTMSDMSAEEHVNKGVALHEAGHLQESTWHLRHAAKQGHPTGMLLYALACRHGWGMRPNPKEAVEWLRKAANSASVEIADEEDQIKEGKRVDVNERKTRKAQFALSVYELGVSHMNGWGTEQDKVLALRCFEIAAAWGDVDALAEAGFCYAQGIGCKKDLKKSAKYYREAEARGMNMVGNSWIHKPKYMDDDDKQKQQRSKSKSRKSLFSRKKDQ
ncbi:hypothetical protein VTJ04DRAFT_1471 [Mycothermus thermophilus]|uniref:uncharacterized protein n=1 Tax=Humicola insolens TaxID=85995 RepID=UPI0037438DF7